VQSKGKNQFKMSDTAREVAKMLLNINAIKLNVENPFTWASGWKSPIYCDNRLSLSYPEVRKFIKEKIVANINANFPGTESIAGVATAGIPQGALVADALELPFVYVRSKPKGHGMENMIEGKITPGQKVVVIEDLISTGGSSIKAVDALVDAGFEVLGMLSIFTYGFAIANENFRAKDLRLISLSNYEQLIDAALTLNYISPAQVNHLKKWRENPGEWR
jgi:orotate phosphoribosyltransferase